MYALCFYNNCQEEAIVCYGNGGMGMPAKCVCSKHIQEEIDMLYNRITELYNENEKLKNRH